VNGGPNRINKAAFSNSSGVMRKRPNVYNVVHHLPKNPRNFFRLESHSSGNSRRTLIGYIGGVFSVELRLLNIKARLCVKLY